MSSTLRSLCLSLFLTALASAAFAGERIYNLQCDSTPPWIYFDKTENRVVGLWAAMVRGAMKSMGEKHEEFTIFPWARLLEMGLKGELDGVFGATINEERMKVMWFPEEPLMEDPWVLWIRKADVGKLKFTSFEDLKGHTVGLVRGYNYTKEFWDFVKAEKNYEEVTHDAMNLRKLVEGRVDYAVAALRFGGYTAREEGFLEQVVPLTEKTIVNSVFYIMFNKGKVSQEWVQKFSEHLKKFKGTDEYAKLLVQYGK